MNANDVTVRRATLLQWAASICRRTWAEVPWRYFGFTLVMVAWAACISWPEPADRRLRIFGTLLQITGVLTVYVGINRTRRQFAKPGIGRSVIEHFGSLFVRPKHITMHGAGFTLRATLGNAGFATSKPTVVPSLDDRMNALEGKVQELEGQLAAANRKLAEERTAREQADAEERGQRTAAVNDLRGLLVAAQTAGVEISVFGLIWIILGTTLADVPAELIGLLHLK